MEVIDQGAQLVISVVLH